MDWSKYQKNIFKQIHLNKNNIFVEALAGSGKTTTIVKALDFVGKDPTLMVAFTNVIADELKERNIIKNVHVSTMHSYGYSQIKKAYEFNPKKIQKYYILDIVNNYYPNDKDIGFFINGFISFAKLTLTPYYDLEALDKLIDERELIIPDHFSSRRQEIVKLTSEIMTMCRSSKVINFDDMVWLPTVLDLPVRRYDRVFVDEAQDLSPAQIELVIRAYTDRVVAVGDRNQAIFKFAAADKDAVPNIIQRTNALCLPLSITYRCPVLVVKEAQRIVPALEAAPNAISGIVRTSSYDEVLKNAKQNDFIISRTNAPLFALAFALLRQGKKFSIKGRDFGKGLSSWVRSTKARTIKGLISKINKWEEKEIKRLKAADRSYRFIEDKAECLRIVANQYPSVKDVINKLEHLFDQKGGIILTSTHRAKGLEADRVWLLKDTYCRWEGEEEINLLYVGITRAKKELIYCFK